MSLSESLGAARAELPVHKLRLTSVRPAADQIRLYEFEACDGARLPGTEPGAHVDLVLPNGMTRQYSLINAETSPRSYTVAVKLDANGRGGSRYIHESLRAGQVCTVVGPRNNFPLVEDAERTILFAGGIGITPILCMVRRLAAVGRTWTLHYVCRRRGDAAFLDVLANYRQAHLHFDDEHGGRLLDMARLVEAAPADAHLYCCGPQPMLAAFEASARQRPADRVHVEYFTPKPFITSAAGFTVELRRSGKSYFVPPEKTILQVLTEAGMRVASSCEQGICGSCETHVIAGVPEHRDSVLSEAEKAENKTVMICCAGSRSDRLVLDL